VKITRKENKGKDTIGLPYYIPSVMASRFKANKYNNPTTYKALSL